MDIEELVKRLRDEQATYLRHSPLCMDAANTLETLRSQLNDMMTEHGKRLDECARLRVELEEARRDAERYRYMREGDWFRDGLAKTEPQATAYHLLRDRLDATVDAARQQQG